MCMKSAPREEVFRGVFLKSPFSKIIADSGTFSNFIVDFSKVGSYFSTPLCTFYSKVMADGTREHDASHVGAAGG